jgi:hypothetical protein
MAVRIIDHPTWCTREGCERTGEHRSRWRSLNVSGDGELVGLDIRLVRSTTADAPVWVTIVASYEDVHVELPLSVPQARAMRFALHSLLDAAR